MSLPLFCVIGLGKSGLWAAKLLNFQHIPVIVTECNYNRVLKKRAEDLAKLGIKVELGAHRKNFYKHAQCFIVSPAVAYDNPVLEYAYKRDIPLISEIELAWLFSLAPLIAISGTDGKSTVATNAYYLLKKAGYKVKLCGNIGTPFSKVVLQAPRVDFIVVEVSSFQLEHIVHFKPNFGILLNIAPDHLDRYENFEHYAKTKMRLFENQTENDFAILDRSDANVKKYLPAISSQIIDISTYLYPQDKDLNQNKKFIYVLGRLLNISSQIIESCLANFKCLEHRMEFVAEIQGIKFINDSKATTPHATAWALRQIPSSVILIAGGKDKGLDFDSLGEICKEKLKSLILIGEAKEKIKRHLRQYVKMISEAEDIFCATEQAYRLAKAGDYVLFSPMCASFDMFHNYRERGRKFKEAVSKLSCSYA